MFILIALLLVFSQVLGACAPNAAPAPEEAAPAAAAAPAAPAAK